MKRYIKVKGQWIDTLKALNDGICYLIINNKVIDAYTDTQIGTLEDESDVI